MESEKGCRVLEKDLVGGFVLDDGLSTVSKGQGVRKHVYQGDGQSPHVQFAEVICQGVGLSVHLLRRHKLLGALHEALKEVRDF